MAEDDDSKLFREAVRGARPLRQRKAERRRPRLRPQAALRRADERRVLEESLTLDAAELGVETGEDLVYRRADVPAATLARLQRGHYARAAELDLHGMTRDEARAVLRAFLADCLAEGHACVGIVHGKGRRSGARGPVLKAAVGRWLVRTAAVRAFCSARRVDGGTGAIYVLLER